MMQRLEDYGLMGLRGKPVETAGPSVADDARAMLESSRARRVAAVEARLGTGHALVSDLTELSAVCVALDARRLAGGLSPRDEALVGRIDRAYRKLCAAYPPPSTAPPKRHNGRGTVAVRGQLEYRSC